MSEVLYIVVVLLRGLHQRMGPPVYTKKSTKRILLLSIEECLFYLILFVQASRDTNGQDSFFILGNIIVLSDTDNDSDELERIEKYAHLKSTQLVYF